MAPEWFDAATAGSETGAVARAVDWAATPLGPPLAWPQPLRAAVELCFGTRFPIMIAWGPDLIQIYNDGFRAMLGSQKHPAAMGVPVRETWREIWPQVGPSFDRVVRTGEPNYVVDQLLVIDRSGFPEEAYFTYSYSPLRDEHGAVQGVLDIATETTTQVVDRRRMRCLSDLSLRLQTLGDDISDLLRAVVEVLGADREDVAAADIFLRTGDTLLLLATTRTAGRGVGPPDAFVRHVTQTMRRFVHGRSLVAPLTTAGEATAVGAIVLDASARRPFDEGYRAFLHLVATTVGAAVSGALRRARELGDLREVSETLQRAMLPRDAVALGTVGRYRPATGKLAVGGDWYDAVDLGAGRRALVVGDCVGHGLEAAALMGQLRSASRALLLEDRGPASTLEALDRFAAALPGGESTTVFCAIVDEADGTVTYASAGHPPALLVRDAGTAWLEEAVGTPLAVRSGPRAEATTRLAPGDLLLLYTDGLVERRTESLSDGLTRLGHTAGVLAASEATMEGFVEVLLRALVPDSGQDDVALLLYRRPDLDEAPPRAPERQESTA